MKLHITNGDCAGDMLQEANGIDGAVLCWRDLLHDGPVLSQPALNREARINFVTDLLESSDLDIDDPKTLVAKDFTERDQVLARAAEFDEIVLWFEHDLYDQLQLLDVCQHLYSQLDQLPKLSIICIDDHPAVPFFHGFGNLTPDMLVGLYPGREPLTAEQLKSATDIWSALTAASPERLAEYAAEPVKGWPYMQKALRRFCCEFPALETGLTLTQTYLLLTLLKAPDELPALEVHLALLEQHGRLPVGVTAQSRYYEILSGPATFQRIFHHLQRLEVDPFMGDLSVKHELDRLIGAEEPYVSVTEGESEVYSLTAAGAEALQGIRHWQQGNHYGLWRGGVEITDDNLWLWDQQHKQFSLHA